MRLFPLIAIAFLLTACGSQPSAEQAVESSTETPAGETAPANDGPVQLVDFPGYEAHLETLAEDELQLINFWATWCKPCVAELPYFEAVREAYADKGVELTYVSLDFDSQLESKVLPFLAENPLGGNLLLITDTDYNSWIDKVSPDWSGAIPATLFMRKSDGLYEFHERGFDQEDLEKLIDEHLKIN